MKDDYTISDKHVPLRVAAFVLAFIVAVGAITVGVTNIGRKQAGYNTVEPAADDSAPLYAAGTALQYRFSGSRSQIKESYNALQRDHSAALARAYKLLDAENLYAGLPNLAALNRSGGAETEVPEELYAILLDALARTREGKGYNMFAGALYAAWTDILILSDPEGFDPVNDPDQRERLARLAAATADLDNFTLEVVSPERHSLRFTVSAAYMALLEELEIDAPVLELNLLHDAYELSLVRDALEAKGWTEGYLESDSGLTLLLSGQEELQVRIYGLRQGTPTPAASAPVSRGAAVSRFRAFALAEDEVCFYTLTDDAGGTVFRHPYLTAAGEYPGVASSSLAVSGDGSAVEAVWANIRLWSCRDEGEIRALERTEPAAVGWTLPEGGQEIYINPAGEGKILPAEEYGWIAGR